MSDERSRILVSGWRGLPHSYAVVNQFQCLELLRRPEVQLYFEDMRYYGENWQRTQGLFSPADERAIAQIPPLPAGVTPDAELRIIFPYDLLRPPRSKRTCVFGTAEYRAVPPHYISEQMPLGRAHRLHDGAFVIITPSHWSREGFIRSGADPQRVVVVPHGVDPALFHSPTPQQRAAARAKLQLADDEFVFLTIGAMTGNKNLMMLLSVFASVLRRHPRAKLVLKGIDALYPSQQMLSAAASRALSADAAATVLPRLVYIGQSLSFADMASLYHTADCYVSPYLAEGFNIPALEAAACGLPVICTAGGPTDDFTTEGFARRIKSSEAPVQHEPGVLMTAVLPDAQHLEQLMQAIVVDHEFRKRASQEGPAHIAANFTWKHVVDKLLTVLLPR